MRVTLLCSFIFYPKMTKCDVFNQPTQIATLPNTQKNWSHCDKEIKKLLIMCHSSYSNKNIKNSDLQLFIWINLTLNTCDTASKLPNVCWTRFNPRASLCLAWERVLCQLNLSGHCHVQVCAVFSVSEEPMESATDPVIPFHPIITLTLTTSHRSTQPSCPSPLPHPELSAHTHLYTRTHTHTQLLVFLPHTSHRCCYGYACRPIHTRVFEPLNRRS